MKVIYNGKRDKVIECVDFINELFDVNLFFDAIAQKETPFSHTNYDTENIASLLKADINEIVIKLYKSRNPFTKANAYVSSRHKNTLFLNTRKLWRDKHKIINTIVHECVHVVDYSENGQIDFGHGNNDSKGKGNSAPYWIGNLAKDLYLESLESEVEIEKHEIDENLIINE